MRQEKGEKQNISGRTVALAAGLFLLSLLPLLVLGRYNVMCIDDYDYGRRVHETFLETGSFGAAAQTAWQQNLEVYQEWQGTYVSCFLMAMCPMNFRYDAAWVVPVLMIGMLASSSFFLGRHILVRWLGCEKKGAALAVLLLLFTFYQVMDAPFEGIYWYNGATHYVLLQALWFFLLLLMSETLWAETGIRRCLCCLLATLLSVIVGGGNLVTGLQAEILMAFLAGYAIWKERKKIGYVIIPFLTGTAGFLVNILAPGNAQRSGIDIDEGYGAVKAVLLSFYHAAVFAVRFTPVPVLLLWLALLPLLWKLAKASKRDFSHPLWVTAGAYCVFSAMFTPTLFALGKTGLSRVDNIIQITYYLAALLVTTYWLGYLSHGANGGAAAFDLFLERAGRPMSLAFLTVLLAVWLLTPDKNTYTSISALRSLVKGEAQTFYEESMERHALYIDETVTDVEVAPYSAKPYLFSFEDLSESPENWLNLAVSQYFHKESVRLADERKGAE